VTLKRPEVASLGGLAAAHKLGADGRKRRASAGGQAVLESRGRAYYKAMAYRRWGRLGPEKEKRPRTNRALPKGVADAAGTPSSRS
jgi:hypothetical protein